MRTCETHSTVLAYARTLDLWGQSGKFDVIVPYAWLSGDAEYAGQPVERETYRIRRPAAAPVHELHRGACALDEGIRRLPAGSHCRGKPAGGVAHRTIRCRQAGQHRQQSLVRQARTRRLEGVGAVGAGTCDGGDDIRRQRGLLRRPAARAGSDLFAAGASRLQLPLRNLGRIDRHLFHRRSHHHRWGGRKTICKRPRARG